MELFINSKIIKNGTNTIIILEYDWKINNIFYFVNFNNFLKDDLWLEPQSSGWKRDNIFYT